MNAAVLRVATLYHAALGLVASYVLVAALALGARLLPVYLGLNLPLAFGGTLFVYKSYAGIRKPRVALVYWAVWSAYATLLANTAIWLRRPADLPGGALVLLLVQLSCLWLCAGRGWRGGEARWPGLLIALLCALLQLWVLSMVASR